MESGSLARVEQRQVETNSLLVEMIGLMETMNDNQTEIAERLVNLEAWLKEPPKSDLPDLLKRLTTVIEAMQAQIVALPAAVARAVHDGVVPS